MQKKLPLINSAHGSDTRNIINELIKLFNGMGYTYNESLQKAHDILDEAQQTNDMNENVQQQINTLIAESGTSDAEVLQARIDSEGNEYPVLKDRLDETDAQLAHIATNIKTEHNANGNGNDSDVQAIIDGSQDNTTLLFPSGTYVIDSHTIISNKVNLTWVAVGEVILLDTCKDVLMENGSTGKGANGIQFVNCEINFEGNFKLENNATTGTIDETEMKNIVPFIDFYKCKGVKFNLISNGYSQPYGTGTNDDIDSVGAQDTMRCYTFRFWDCERVEVDSSKLLKGRLEPYGFLRVKDLTFSNSIYFQGEDSTTFWSYAKIIDCQNVRVKGLRVQSDSTGSFMDISGDNIICENIIIDYPNGKLFDITQEWGYNNVETGKVVIRDCETNSDGLIVTALRHNYLNNLPINELIVDNVRVVNSNEKSRSNFAGSGLIKKLTVKNSIIENIDHITFITLSGDSTLLDWQNFNYENLDIICSTNIDGLATYIVTNGKTVVKDSYINLQRHRHLHLLKRAKEGTSDLSLNDKHIEIQNTKFKDTEIRITSNVLFDNCDFENCNFYVSASGGNYNPNITFIGCDIDFNNVDNLDAPSNLFDVSTSATIEKLKMKNVNINGKAINGVFSTINHVTKEILFDNVGIDLGVDVILFDNVSNIDSIANFYITKSNIKGTLLSFNRGASSVETINKYQIIDTAFYVGTTQSILVNEDVGLPVYGTILRVKGCTFNKDNVTHLNGYSIDDMVEVNNAENFTIN